MLGDGCVAIQKLPRSISDAMDRGKISIARATPDAIWLNEYADRVVYDDSGFFEEFLSS